MNPNSLQLEVGDISPSGKKVISTVKWDMSWREFRVLINTWDTNLKARNVQQN